MEYQCQRKISFFHSDNCSNCISVCCSECTKALDLVLMLDRSGHLSPTDYKFVISFAKTLISFFGVSRTLSQVALVTISDTPATQFTFTDYPTDLAIHNALTAQSTSTIGRRDITGAIRHVRQKVFRPDVGARCNDTKVPQVGRLRKKVNSARQLLQSPEI